MITRAALLFLTALAPGAGPWPRAIDLAERRQNARSSRRDQGGRNVEPRRQGWGFHLCRRHAGHRPRDQHFGPGPSGPHPAGLP